MDINGIININKPSGITSHTVVGRVRRFFDCPKVGHGGTLDPMATGVLPIMVGTGVKASEWLAGADKGYIAGIALGIETDSQDLTGEIIRTHEGPLPSYETFETAAKSFVGEIMQTPPMYSAIKKDGKKLVDLARRGITIERDKRKVNIYSLDTFSENGDLYLKVFCSKGTYIRTLCEDIGKALGCGAAMSSLIRINAGPFNIEESIELDKLLDLKPEKAKEYVVPTQFLFTHYPILTLPDFFERLFKNGAAISLTKINLSALVGEIYRVNDANGFFALGEIITLEGEKHLKVKKFF